MRIHRSSILRSGLGGLLGACALAVSAAVTPPPAFTVA